MKSAICLFFPKTMEQFFSKVTMYIYVYIIIIINIPKLILSNILPLTKNYSSVLKLKKKKMDFIFCFLSNMWFYHWCFSELSAAVDHKINFPGLFKNTGPKSSPFHFLIVRPVRIEVNYKFENKKKIKIK